MAENNDDEYIEEGSTGNNSSMMKRVKCASLKLLMIPYAYYLLP